MAMQFNIESFVEFIAAISSLFIGSFFVLISIFNQDIKAFIYLAGAFFTYIISGLVFSPFLQGLVPDINERSFVCDIVKFWDCSRTLDYKSCTCQCNHICKKK